MIGNICIRPEQRQGVADSSQKEMLAGVGIFNAASVVTVHGGIDCN